MSPAEQASTDTAGVLAPPPLVYAIPLVAGLLIQRSRPIQLVPAGMAVPIGVALVALGLVGIPAILAFRRARTSPKPWKPTTALVTDGPFRYSRNPMYLGFTLLYVGISAWVNAAWPIFFLPVVLGVMHFGVVVREEAYLERRFGVEYRAYRERVRRWI